jgi:hypothetical protein
MDVLPLARSGQMLSKRANIRSAADSCQVRIVAAGAASHFLHIYQFVDVFLANGA